MITKTTQQLIEEASKKMADVSAYQAKTMMEVIALQAMMDGLEMAKDIYSEKVDTCTEYGSVRLSQDNLEGALL